MIVTIDEDAGIVVVRDGTHEQKHPLASAEGFAAVSRVWLRAGWDAKYVYGFSWFGRPVIQLPDDLIRIQEVIYRVKPDVLIEIGVAHGGSLMFYASLFKAMGRGRVIGVDIDIRPHNRAAIESHELFPLITLIEGNSTDRTVVERIRSSIKSNETVLVILDGKHTRQHVLEELRTYAPLISVSSYIVATDGIMGQIAGAPRTESDWTDNNPLRAARDFVTENPAFQIEEPAWPFNEGLVKHRVTYWPDAFIRRIG